MARLLDAALDHQVAPAQLRALTRAVRARLAGPDDPPG
jgi:hypothetical protein